MIHETDSRAQAATVAATEDAAMNAMEMRISPLHLNAVPAPNKIANDRAKRAPRVSY